MTPAERSPTCSTTPSDSLFRDRQGAQSDAGGRPGTRQSWPWDAFGTLIPATSNRRAGRRTERCRRLPHRGEGGGVAALVDLLDPQIVERIAIAGQPVVEIRGAESVAGRAREFSSNYTDARSALINGERLDRLP